jgi:hypothetical protein
VLLPARDAQLLAEMVRTGMLLGVLLGSEPKAMVEGSSMSGTIYTSPIAGDDMVKSRIRNSLHDGEFK